MSYNDNKEGSKAGATANAADWESEKNLVFTLTQERQFTIAACVILNVVAVLSFAVSTGAALIGMLFGAIILLLLLANVLSTKMRVARQNEEASYRHFENVKRAVEQSPVGIMVTDMDWNIQYANNNFAELFGADANRILGVNAKLSSDNWITDAQMAEIDAAMAQGDEWQTPLVIDHLGGEPYRTMVTLTPIRDQDLKVRRIMFMCEGTKRRKTMMERLYMRSNFDGLTDLPNRDHIVSVLQDAINGGAIASGSASEELSRIAVLGVDIDGFTQTNNSLGTEMGDILLCEVSRRINGVLRSHDELARLGSDSFLAMLLHADHEQSRAVVERINERLAIPFVLGDREVTVSACIGVANFPEQGHNSLELVSNCEAALDTAKRKGKGSVHVYQSELCAETAARLAIENQLYHAISRNELSIHYQPVIGLQDGELLGAEALIRWNNRELGNVPPDKFIAIAEESGMIRPIGDWVLEHACITAAKWEHNGLDPLRVAINISSRQFDENLILAGVRRALEVSGLPADRLELEITEGLLLSDSAQTLEAILQLKHIGARLMLDDFGTGYSSLSYIQRFPFDGLKIDRCFVRDLAEEGNQRSLAHAIIAMAQSLNLRVIAEGVEELGQRKILKSYGCDAAQGFLYSKPLPAEQFEIWARDYQKAHASKRAAGVVDEL